MLTALPAGVHQESPGGGRRLHDGGARAPQGLAKPLGVHRHVAVDHHNPRADDEGEGGVFAMLALLHKNLEANLGRGLVLAGLFVHGQEGQPPPGVPTVSVAELLAQGKQLEGRKRGRESFLDGRVPRGVSFPRCRDDRGKRWAAWRTTC